MVKEGVICIGEKEWPLGSLYLIVEPEVRPGEVSILIRCPDGQELTLDEARRNDFVDREWIRKVILSALELRDLSKKP